MIHNYRCNFENCNQHFTRNCCRHLIYIYKTECVCVCVCLSMCSTLQNLFFRLFFKFLCHLIEKLSGIVLVKTELKYILVFEL